MMDSFSSSYSAHDIAASAPLRACARMRSTRPDSSFQSVSGIGAFAPASRYSTSWARRAVNTCPPATSSGASVGPCTAGANTPCSSRRLSASPRRGPAATAQWGACRRNASGYTPSGAFAAASSYSDHGRAAPSAPRSVTPATSNPSGADAPENDSRTYCAGCTSSCISTSKSPVRVCRRPIEVQSSRLVDISTTVLEAKPLVPQSTRTLPTGFTDRRSSSTVAAGRAARHAVARSPSSSAAASGSAAPSTQARGWSSRPLISSARRAAPVPSAPLSTSRRMYRAKIGSRDAWSQSPSPLVVS